MRIEHLERRTHLSVTRDAAGWTVVTPASDTRIIYVSSSQGNDSNSGLSTGAAVRTLTCAQAIVRDGFADWVLLKRGDTFGSFGRWDKKGRSAQEPIYIATYDTGARPQINSGVSYGFRTTDNGGGRRIDNVIISSLSFSPHTYNGSNGDGNGDGTIDGDTVGIQLLCRGTNVTIEDCKVAGFKDNIVIGDSSGDATHAVTNTTVRRSQILDSYALTSGYRSQGVYMSSIVSNITIEENVVDHNGWRTGVDADRTSFNHNLYAFNNAQNIVVRDNISAQSSFYGLKFNAGGTASGNFFARNSESVYLEAPATVVDNVITEAVDFPTNSYGVGINTQTATSATIRHNLITKIISTGTSNRSGINLNSVASSFTGTIEDNIIYNWKGTGITNATPGNGAGSVVIRNNQVQMATSSDTGLKQQSTTNQSRYVYQGNVYAATTQTSVNRYGDPRVSLNTWKSSTGESDARYQVLSYPDPTRDIQRYSTVLGGAGTFESFMAAARGMDKLNWNSAYTAPAINAWLWQGFGTDTAGPTVLSTTFGFETQPLTLDVRFSENISGLTTADLTVRRLSNGAVIPFTLASYNPATMTGRFTFAGILADGNYEVTVPAGSVVDASQNLLTVPHVSSFFVFAGDANHDRRVNGFDFNALAANFGKTGQTFSQGDFNYDGLVNALDFALLASRFNTVL